MDGSFSPRKVYKNAPIIEAVVDFRFVPEEEGGLLKLYANSREQFSTFYPDVRKQIRNEIKIDPANQTAPTSFVPHEALRLASLDGKKILHIESNCFILSQLAPYENWETLVQAMKNGLETLFGRDLNRKIARIGIRFINRFDLPGPSVELSDYLKVYPQIPFAFDINSFTMQSVFPLDDINSKLVIRQALVPSPKSDAVSILLDFELFNEEERLFTPKVWDFLEHFHQKKNDAFERSITDKLRKIIL